MVPEVGCMHAGEDLDQRRLAGAVVADERHDLAGMDVELDVGQRRDGAEVLADAAQAQDQLARWAWDAVGHAGMTPPGSAGGRRPAARPGDAVRRGSLDAELRAALGVAAGAELRGRLDALVDDLGLEVLARHHRPGRRAPTACRRASSSARASRRSGTATATLAAAAPTISEGLEMVLYWSPAMMSCSAAIVASLPVTGGSGSTPAALKRRDRAAAGAVVGRDDADDLGRRSG